MDCELMLEKVFRIGEADALGGIASRGKEFLTVSEQLAYRKGYNSALEVDDANQKPLDQSELKSPRQHQRVGADSNAQVGREFEETAKAYFSSQGIDLEFDHAVEIGIDRCKKFHAFDLGCDRQKILVECKSHRWTVSGNVPSAKLTVWNEAMYYFLLAPKEFRKIMFVAKHLNNKRGMTLAQYYCSTFSHLIPEDVEIFEYDEDERIVTRILGKAVGKPAGGSSKLDANVPSLILP